MAGTAGQNAMITVAVSCIGPPHRQTGAGGALSGFFAWIAAVVEKIMKAELFFFLIFSGIGTIAVLKKQT
ncbi:hypothetical protein [Jeongeupia chitinilytica]|uniref:hypothetical protein n=1 Tax=Jeongeupia chitinilytica TaxID=1041641 RepID=UPI001672D057|nr:hypothetical protein [Jeongeupia chitinilytica]